MVKGAAESRVAFAHRFGISSFFIYEEFCYTQT
jgi:hypothetical protein